VNGSTYPGPGGLMAKLNAPSKTVLLCEIKNAYAYVWPTAGVSYSGTMEPYSPSADGAWDLWAFGNTPAAQLTTGIMGNRAQNAATYIGPNPLGRHSGGSNFLMCDGHVKWMMGSSVSTGLNALLPGSTETAGDDRSPAYADGTADSAYAITFSGY